MAAITFVMMSFASSLASIAITAIIVALLSIGRKA